MARRAFFRGQRAVEEELLGFFTAQLAAGCLGNASERQQVHTIGREAESLRDVLGYRGGYRGPPRCIALSHFRGNDQFFRSRGFILYAEGDDAALANAFRPRGEFLHFVRIQIASALDDDVLEAAGHVDFAIAAIRAIAGIDPSELLPARWRTERQQLFRRPGVVVVAGRCRRSAEPQKTLGAVRNFLRMVVYDAQFMPRQHRTGRNKRNRTSALRLHRKRPAMHREGFALDAIDERAAMERWHGNCQGGFGEAVHRQMRFVAKAVAREPRRSSPRARNSSPVLRCLCPQFFARTARTQSSAQQQWFPCACGTPTTSAPGESGTRAAT